MKQTILLATLISIGLEAGSSAAIISVNFWNSSAGNMGNNTVGAGEIAGNTGAAAQNWNNYGSTGGTGAITLTNVALNDDSGVASGA